MPAIPSRKRIEQLFDSFESLDKRVRRHDPIGFAGYRDDLDRARTASGTDEAVLTGIGRIAGQEVVAAVFEFDFLGGSMGVEVGNRIVRAMKLSAKTGRPFLAITSTGGARMQEGMSALAQMARTAAASEALARKGIPRITILGHPTTGGVYASFASLADFIAAEEPATIGFAGPRVSVEMTGEDLPAGSHTGRSAFEAGLADALIKPEETSDWLARLLGAMSKRGTRSMSKPAAAAQAADSPLRPAWESFEIARNPDRPSPRWYAEAILGEVTEIRGDRMGTDDPAVFCCVGVLDSTAIAVAAINRASPGPGGFRKLQRTIRLAERLRIPVVTMIDTPGADPGHASEYGGVAGEIARTFETLLRAKTPVVSIVTGEGGSGGALAVACGDVVMIQENAVFSVISPEGAATILHRDASKAREVAGQLKPTASDLISLGLADHIVAEPPGGAHTDPDAAALLLGNAIRLGLSQAKGSVPARMKGWR
ncbi:MAG: acetyl-CoA carboxylase carboxyltransferase subunit alpha/beta [Actinobacteria bacterium]|nr:acetyl-CoA carboxylase carboxyltransferase subunit alpha/beta [Actinomycetota bacterium]